MIHRFNEMGMASLDPQSEDFGVETLGECQAESIRQRQTLA